jgi:hypothetical protein
MSWRGNALLGALFGAPFVYVWFAARSEMTDTTAALVVIAILFVVAGSVGARRSGSMAGGALAGFAAGAMSALTVPGDYLLFHTAPYFPFFDTVALLDTLATAAAAVMLLATAGAALARITNVRGRMRGGVRGFLDGWRTAG